MEKTLLKRLVSILLFLITAITSTAVFAYAAELPESEECWVITGGLTGSESFVEEKMVYNCYKEEEIQPFLDGTFGLDEAWIRLMTKPGRYSGPGEIMCENVNFVFHLRNGENHLFEYYMREYNGPGKKLNITTELDMGPRYFREVQNMQFRIGILSDFEKLSVRGCAATVEYNYMPNADTRYIDVDYGILYFNENSCGFPELYRLHVGDQGIAFVADFGEPLDDHALELCVSGSGLLINGSEGTIMADERFTLYFHWTLPEGYTLTIEEGQTFVIHKETDFTNNGTIINKGNIVVQGNFINNGSFICENHNYDENGFCICGSSAPATMDSENRYAISNAGDLFWLSRQINSGEITKFNAVLTNDIKIPDGKEWTPIELPDGMENSSVFDGCGYTIDLGRQSCGLFSRCNYSAVKNLILKGNITANTDTYAAAVSASSYRTTFENIISYVSVSNTGAGDVGGLVGYFGGGYDVANEQYSMIKNCAVYADVSGNRSVGGLIGCMWDGKQPCRVLNSAFSGNLNGSSIGGIAGNNLNSSAVTSSFTDCYYFCKNAPDISYVGSDNGGKLTASRVSAKTGDQFASGEVTWLLNFSSTDGPWKQTLGTDEYPNHTGIRVYYVNSEYTNEKDGGTAGDDSVQDEDTPMVPVATMVGERPALLFTGILIVVALAIGTAFTIKTIRLKKKTK